MSIDEKKEEKNKIGRPTEYNEEICNEICEVVSSSPKMLEELCEENQHWPAPTTIYRWRIRHLEFGQKYAYAKQCQIEPLVSSMFCKIRSAKNDFYEDKEGKLAINTSAIQRLRLEVDNIKWKAGKLMPKVYGDKINKSEEEISLVQQLIDRL